MSNIDPKEIQAVVAFARVGLRVLSERTLTYLGFVGTCLIFGRAAWEPTAGTITAASVFAVLVFWPLLLSDIRKRGAQHGNPE